MTTQIKDPAELLQTEFQSLPLVEVLQKPPTALLGVSDAASTALGNIGVKTVFDLALSRVFDAAGQLPARPYHTQQTRRPTK
jgi:hypothetical protein